MCVACRTSSPARQMIRFARHPDGTVGVDVRARLEGRGAWTCPTYSCVARSVERGGLARAFDAAILVDAGALQGEVDRVFAQEAFRGLSLARRMGRLWPGRTEAIDAAKRAPTTTFVIWASDLAARSREEVEHSLPTAFEIQVGGSKVEMGEALGRRPTGVIALQRGPQTEWVMADLSRLATFRGSQPDPSPLDATHEKLPAAKLSVKASEKTSQTKASTAQQSGLETSFAKTNSKKRGTVKSCALRDVAPKRTSATDETPPYVETHLLKRHERNERPRYRTIK